MSSPFELSLEDYAVLWEPLPYGKGKFLERSSELSGRIAAGRSPEEWGAANELRDHYREIDPERSRLYLAWMLEFNKATEPNAAHDYELNIMSGWMRGQDDAQATRNLLRFAVESDGYSSIQIVCLLGAAEICLQHQMWLEARRMCAACFVKNTYYMYDRVRLFYNQLVDQTEVFLSNNLTQEGFNLLSPRHTRVLKCLFEDLGLDDVTESVLKSSQAVIKLSTEKRSASGWPVTSHLGGVPDVEERWQWPGRMEFLAQLNLKELTPYDGNDVLPPRGLLRFFMEDLGYGCQGDWFRVEFYDGDLTKLQKAQVPEFLTDLRGVPNERSDNMVYDEVALHGKYGVYLGTYEGDWNDQQADYELSDVISLYFPHALEDVTYENGIYQDKAYQVLGLVPDEAFIPNIGEEKDWVLLFAIQSCKEAKMMFSDAGTMYFYIRREDLLARRFDRVEVSMING